MYISKSIHHVFMQTLIRNLFFYFYFTSPKLWMISNIWSEFLYLTIPRTLYVSAKEGPLGYCKLFSHQNRLWQSIHSLRGSINVTFIPQKCLAKGGLLTYVDIQLYQLCKSKESIAVKGALKKDSLYFYVQYHEFVYIDP